MIKAILFDLDGTLIDSEAFYMKGTYAWLKDFKNDLRYEDIYPIIGLTYENSNAYLGKLANLSTKEATILNDEYFRNHPLCFKDVLFDDVKESFIRLKQSGIKIAICSLSEHEYVKRFTLECGLEKYVDYYIGGDRCHKQKPDPEIYLKALEVLKLNANEVLVVEDSENGILAAKNAGLLTYARDASRFNINQEKADKIINNLNELIGVVV